MSIFPDDSAERKTFPLYSGVLQYFPSALAKLANHSYVSNEKHNPGEAIHWARGKSDDHLDAAARHLVEGDLAGLAWRALAALQLQCEEAGAPMAPGARVGTLLEVTCLDGAVRSFTPYDAHPGREHACGGNSPATNTGD